MTIPLWIGNSTNRSILIIANENTKPPQTINGKPQFDVCPYIPVYISVPIISPTFAHEAQHPTKKPLPFLGNQLPKEVYKIMLISYIKLQDL